MGEGCSVRPQPFQGDEYRSWLDSSRVIRNVCDGAAGGAEQYRVRAAGAARPQNAVELRPRHGWTGSSWGAHRFSTRLQMAPGSSAPPAGGSCDITNPSPERRAVRPSLTSFRTASRALNPC